MLQKHFIMTTDKIWPKGWIKSTSNVSAWHLVRSCCKDHKLNTSDFWRDFTNLPIVAPSVSSFTSTPQKVKVLLCVFRPAPGTRLRARAKKAKSCYLTRDTLSARRVCGFSRLPDSCPPSKCNNEISAQAHSAAQCDETLLRQQGSATLINIYLISRLPLL